MRTNRRRAIGSLIGMDSLVDVVTNTNGMLLLLAVFTTLLALGKTYRVGFPVVQPTEKQPVYFECYKNRVFYIVTGTEYGPGYSLSPLEGGRLMVTVKDEQAGESLANLRNREATFWRLIKGMSPDNQYAAFIVRPDSFEIFRSIRDELKTRPVEVGWEPLAQGAPLIIGPGGRSLGVQ